MKNLELFRSFGKGRKQVSFKNLVFEVFWDKEDEALLDEILSMVESKFKEEEERISKFDPDVDWATILVNVVIDLSYRYTLLKKEYDKLQESVKFNIQRIDSAMEEL